jgi:Ca2+-transporting ATPase
MEVSRTANLSSTNVEEVLRILETSNDGLTSEDAKSRLTKYGENVLPTGGKLTKLQVLIAQFKNLFIIILAVTGGITMAMGDIKDSLFILVAMMVNVVMGFYQENKAETALQNLRSYTRYRTRVIREGFEKEIEAETLVPGDIVNIFAGARAPADLRIIKTNALAVDESILTGESLPVTSKSAKPVSTDVPISDQTSMIFAGTFISEGTATAVVAKTGKNTEIGKIATAVTSKKREQTPLQKEISKFSLVAAIVLAFMIIAVVIAGLFRGYEIVDMLLMGVAMAVSAVPEGLPIALTVILAIGVERLAKRKGVIKRLLAAETLGSVSVILTDKTGTLTEAKMTLSKIISNQSEREILEQAILNVDAVVENPEEPFDNWRIIGRPLEVAILKAAGERGINLKESFKKIKIISKEPFNSEVKFSRTEFELDRVKTILTMGAPEAVLASTNLLISEKNKILLQVEELAYSGYRILAVARNQEFMGLLSFSDPIREGVKEAITAIGKSGVKTVIVTGDHVGTAVSIARQVGLNPQDDSVFTHSNLVKMDEAELGSAIKKAVVFARVTPEDKLMIVGAYRRAGELVAMTGDGVNDAPALKEADIGVAVGSGTDVAQGAADLVILDDNFETIVKAIAGGRKIIDNIKKVVVYLLSDSFDELMVIGGAIAFGLPIPINALQILYVNIFSDSLPAVAFAFEDGGDYISAGKHRRQGIFSDRYVRFLIIVIGLISSALLFAVYYFLLRAGHNEEMVKTFIFASFSIYTLFLVFPIKNFKKNIFQYSLVDNKLLVGGFLSGILLTIIAVYMPFAGKILKTVPLPPFWAIGVLMFALFNVAFIELGKGLVHRFSKNHPAG